MRLESISIKNLRGVKHVEAYNFGELNVFIGRNNSGKSTLLSAIDYFFNCLSNNDVVNVNPPIGKDVDFLNKDTSKYIVINAYFQIEQEEREDIVLKISTEAPQMKNAAMNLEQDLGVSIELHITPSPNNYSYIHKITLHQNKPSEPFKDSGILVLEMSKETAEEFYGKTIHQINLKKDIEDISSVLSTVVGSSRNNFIRDRFSESKSTRREAIPVSFLIRELPSRPSKELVTKIEYILDQSSGYDDFVDHLRTNMALLEAELNKTNQQTLKNKLLTYSGEELSTPRYIYSLIKAIGEINVLHLTERRKRIGKEEAERLLSLKVQRGGTDVLRNIQEIVFALLGVQIDAFQGSTSSRLGDSSAELDVDNFLVELNGSGIREALRLILDFEFTHPKVLLVEEPEIHLHPALELSMMRYLKKISQDCQVFLTTHSTNFLDTGAMKNIYLISKKDNTNVKHLDVTGVEELIPEELGIRLSSLFMYDRLVFVEGHTDEQIIREWASLMRKNLSQSNVGFITMGGARNYTHFANEKILSFLTKRRVQLWFIFDKDERDNNTIKRLQEIGGTHANVHILNKREIENYLLISRPLMELIKHKAILGGIELPNDFNESQIANDIESMSSKLKKYLVAKKVKQVFNKPFSLNPIDIPLEDESFSIQDCIEEEIQTVISRLESLKSEIVKTYYEQEDEVSKIWDRKKLDLVPGDILLDLVCRKYNLRYKKEKDSQKLASLMRENEIDHYIKNIIISFTN